MKFIVLLLLSLVTFSVVSASPAKKAASPEVQDKANHSDHEKEEKGHDEHDHETESSSKPEHEHEEDKGDIGPDKGITAFSEENGFSLSKEAIKNFSLNTVNVSNAEMVIPASAILYSGEEINLYRLRADFYKRIDFRLISKTAKEAKISSPDLKVGDEIVTTGIGFLRAAEIVATGGAPEGHSH